MIQTLGAATLGALWLPLLAWTVIVAVVLAALRVWRSGHALAQYAARLALLAALPLGLLLAAVVDPKVVRGIGGGCDEEAVRALMATTFKPGRQRGEPVKVKMSIPITFKLAAEAATPDPDARQTGE